MNYFRISGSNPILWISNINNCCFQWFILTSDIFFLIEIAFKSVLRESGLKAMLKGKLISNQKVTKINPDWCSPGAYQSFGNLLSFFILLLGESRLQSVEFLNSSRANVGAETLIFFLIFTLRWKPEILLSYQIEQNDVSLFTSEIKLV